MNDDAQGLNPNPQAAPRPIVVGYNPTPAPAPVASPAAPTPIKINIQDGSFSAPANPTPTPQPSRISIPINAVNDVGPAPLAMPHLAPRPISFQPAAATSPQPVPAPEPMPTPVATPTPPAQPSGLQAKVDSHPLFSGTTDAAATGQHKPKKVRSRVGRLLVWLLIILIILLPALYVAIDAGLINVGINLPFHIFK